MQRRLYAALATGLLAILVASPSLDYGFVHRDRQLVLERPAFWEEGFGSFLASQHWGSGRHLSLATLDIDRLDLLGLHEPGSPRSFHATNIVLAGIVAMLVFSLALQLGLGTPRAFAGALLFAVHPTHVDAQAAITGRAELLAAIGVLTGMLAWLRLPKLGPARQADAAALCGMSLLIGLMAKENAVCLLALLPLHSLLLGPDAPEPRPPRTKASSTAINKPTIGDPSSKGRSATGNNAKGNKAYRKKAKRDKMGRKTIEAAIEEANQPTTRDKIASAYTASGQWMERADRHAARLSLPPQVAFSCAAAFAVWLATAWNGLASMPVPEYPDNPLVYASLPERVLKASAILWEYATLVLAPANLLADRSYSVTDPSLQLGAAALALWCFVAAALWRLRLRDPVVVFLIAWFPVAFLITANMTVPINTVMAERLLYLPSVGILLAIARYWPGLTDSRTPVRGSSWMALLLVAGTFAFAYDARARIWHNDEHYHRQAAEDSPNSARAHLNLADMHYRAGDAVNAVVSAERALAIYPPFPSAARARAKYLLATDTPEAAGRAIEGLNEYLNFRPTDLAALELQTMAQIRVGNREAANQSLTALVELSGRSERTVELLAQIDALRADDAAAGEPDDSDSGTLSP